MSTLEPSRAPFPRFVFETLVLRKLEPKDLAMVRDLSTDEYVPTIGSLPFEASVDQALDWIHRQHRRADNGASFSFAIVDRGTDRALGNIGLSRLNRDSPTAAVGYGICPRERGQGVAALALRALTEFAWTQPELSRLELFIEPSNVASIRTAERAGFTCQALLPRHQSIAGELRDMALFVRTRE